MNSRLFVLALLLLVGVSRAAENEGTPLYDTEHNSVMLGVDISDSLPVVRWITVDPTGASVVSDARLYPYFTSGIVDTTLVDSVFTFPLPVVSFWFQNASATDTLYLSQRGPAFPASYIPVFPLNSFGLEHVVCASLYLDASVDSLPWNLVVLSDSLYIP